MPRLANSPRTKLPLFGTVGLRRASSACGSITARIAEMAVQPGVEVGSPAVAATLTNLPRSQLAATEPISGTYLVALPHTPAGPSYAFVQLG